MPLNQSGSLAVLTLIRECFLKPTSNIYCDINYWLIHYNNIKNRRKYIDLTRYTVCLLNTEKEPIIILKSI